MVLGHLETAQKPLKSACTIFEVQGAVGIDPWLRRPSLPFRAPGRRQLAPSQCPILTQLPPSFVDVLLDDLRPEGEDFGVCDVYRRSHPVHVGAAEGLDAGEVFDPLSGP
jgi:hypothetical protein